MYGDEELGIPPTRLYIEPYAKKALEAARYVYEQVKRLFDEITG